MYKDIHVYMNIYFYLLLKIYITGNKYMDKKNNLILNGFGILQMYNL